MEDFGEHGWDYVGEKPVGSVQEMMRVYVADNSGPHVYRGFRLNASNPECVLLKRCRDGSFVRADKLNGYQR